MVLPFNPSGTQRLVFTIFVQMFRTDKNRITHFRDLMCGRASKSAHVLLPILENTIRNFILLLLVRQCSLLQN
jgi:hypothetical protein